MAENRWTFNSEPIVITIITTKCLRLFFIMLITCNNIPNDKNDNNISTRSSIILTKTKKEKYKIDEIKKIYT